MKKIIVLIWLLCSISYAKTVHIYDPFEQVNRAIFQFNFSLQRAYIVPIVQTTYLKVPQKIRTPLGNATNNLFEPLFTIEFLLQGRTKLFLASVSRFVLNSTFGLLGFIDVAEYGGVPYHETSFRDTLAIWGVPPGPYIVVPFLFPLTIRSIVGMVVDGIINPIKFLLCPSCDFITYALGIGLPIETSYVLYKYAPYLNQTLVFARTSLDFYVFSRQAYYQSLNPNFSGNKGVFVQNKQKNNPLDFDVGS